MKLIELEVKNVRGLRDVLLKFDGKNAVIWGPNGAGKSCVVDAIDFLFTGRISRLTGSGTKGITLSEHGPHIDHAAETATVAAVIQFEGLSTPVRVERCLADPEQLTCPDQARAPFAKLAALLDKGGVILTRRDILRYVTAEAGKRADDIELLLDLKDVDNARSSLHRARTELSREERSADQAIKTAQSNVNVTLGLDKFSEQGLVDEVNVHRQTLGGDPLQTPASDQFKVGILPQAAVDTSVSRLNPVLFGGIIQNVRQAMSTEALAALDLSKIDLQLRADIAVLKANQQLMSELERLALTEQAVRFVDDSTVECPICGANWPEGHIKRQLDTKISAANSAKGVRAHILDSAEDIAKSVRTVKANVGNLVQGLRQANVDSDHDDAEVLGLWAENLDRLVTVLADPIGLYLDSGLQSDRIGCLLAPDGLDHLLVRTEKEVGEAIPQPTPQQTAWDKLTGSEESVRALESRIREKDVAKLYSERSKVLLSEFDKARDSVLGGLYDRIADRFVEYYCVLHDHERHHFSAKLQPQESSLAFEVDFLGRGNHPPHALVCLFLEHSEGHQDSMGVCLFLALNEELAKGKPSLIVFDDVVMSVDSGHRKDVCSLINEQFPDCQFIITTHDRTWMKQLSQERVVGGRQVIEFTGWTVETGPSTHLQMDLWDNIKTDLSREDVHQAAFKLRRGSEDFFESVCDALAAEVAYNSAMLWQLDDWLNSATHQYKDLLAKARAAASSWNDAVALETLREHESVRKQVYDKANVERWTINAAVHFNDWEDMFKEDFEPVVDAFRDLHKLFQCSHCGNLLERLPRKGIAESVKCRCGRVNWNLRRK